MALTGSAAAVQQPLAGERLESPAASSRAQLKPLLTNHSQKETERHRYGEAGVLPLLLPCRVPSRVAVGRRGLSLGHCGFVSFQKHCDRQKANLRIRFKPSLFQHVGTHSSLAGKIQKLKVGTSCLSKLRVALLPGLVCRYLGTGCFWGWDISDSNWWDGGSWLSVQWLCFNLNYSELT